MGLGPTIDNVQLNLQGVTSIAVSTIQPDLNTPQYVRLIQIFTDPIVGVSARPVVTLALYGGDQSVSNTNPLEITIPGGIEF